MGSVSVLCAFVMFLAGVIRGEFTTRFETYLLSPSSMPSGYWLAGSMLLAILVSTGWLVALRHAERHFDDLEKQLHLKEQELRTTRLQLNDSERRIVTDVVTGIPNYASWQRHSKAWVTSTLASRPSALVMIDLDNLKALNERDYKCADMVLRLFASTTYDAMRRNEYAFKTTDANGPSEDVRWTEMYRCYAGGDEFFFHLSDDVYGAIGFLNRLNDQTRRCEAEIKSEVLPKFMKPAEAALYSLSFAAVVLPIAVDTAPEDVIKPALDMLIRVKKHPTSRVLAQFDRWAETPAERLVTLRNELADIERRVSNLPSRPDGPDPKLLALLDAQHHALQARISMLTKAVTTFARNELSPRHRWSSD